MSNTPFYCDLPESSFSVTTEFRAEPGKKFVGDVGGAGELQYWDGAAWNTYDESGPGFTFYVPATGKLQLVVATAPVIFSMTSTHQPT